MRTTVTLDPDVQALLKKAMRKRDSTFKQVLNDALRSALGGAAPAALPKTWEFPTYDCGEPLVDLTKALSLADELGDMELIAKMQRGA